MQTTTTTIPVIQHWGTTLPAPTDTFAVRSLTDGDVLTVHEVMGGMSAQSAYLRLHTGIQQLPLRSTTALARVVDGVQRSHVAHESGTGRAIGLAMWVRSSDTDEAEIAVMIADSASCRRVVLSEHHRMRAWPTRLGALSDPSDPTMLRRVNRHLARQGPLARVGHGRARGSACRPRGMWSLPFEDSPWRTAIHDEPCPFSSTKPARFTYS
ncbi:MULTISPECIES: hypothetical protein [unclassified Yimella]|uniref:hypothetical protein n=1 Tax=unclassified Yimella TaxID=2649892 RepID=UPI00101CB3CC|nr:MULTISPECIES: hypothetical protein [unclassified Yimella]MCG8656281.1 hypothetical protein [Yimella sp. NH-Cas1]RYG77531.1 hypothetical protein EU513_07350 [Yimella sp. RIT 621]